RHGAGTARRTPAREAPPPAAVQARSGTDRPPTATLPAAGTTVRPGTPEAGRRTGGEPVRTISAGYEKITSETARPGRRAVRTGATTVDAVTKPGRQALRRAVPGTTGHPASHFRVAAPSFRPRRDRDAAPPHAVRRVVTRDAT